MSNPSKPHEAVKRVATATSWRPGQSGNPNGRKKGVVTVAMALRARITPEQRAGLLIDLAMRAESEDVKLRARLAILERSDGKVTDRLELTRGEADGDDDEPPDGATVEDLDELDELEAQRQAIFGRIRAREPIAAESDEPIALPVLPVVPTGEAP
jgi:hypothetical protein